MSEVTQRIGVCNVRVELLHSFAVSDGDRPVELARMSQRLVALLALRRRPLARQTLVGYLWPEVPEAKAAAKIRTAVWQTRRECEALVVSDRGRLGLGTSVAVDVRMVEEIAQEGQVTSLCKRSLRDRIDVLRGDLLPTWSEEWVMIERERVRELRLRVLEGIARTHSAAGDYVVAVEAAQAAVSIEPFRDTAQRTLIEVYLLEGNYFEARRQYVRYCEELREEIGVVPSWDLEALIGETS